MRTSPWVYADPETREDILAHISGYAFDRAMVRSDEPMRNLHSALRFANTNERWLDTQRKRSIRR